jgi:predicted Zn finger-like uncharacterized protein
MRIVCPNCSAAYDVPDGLLTGRKAVSCARCGKEWQPAEAAARPEQPVVTRLEAPPLPVRTVQVESEAEAETVIAERRGLSGGDWAIDRLMAAPLPPPGPRLALRFAWVASVVIILAGLGGALVWRADVMAVWPPSTRLFAALGLR